MSKMVEIIQFRCVHSAWWIFKTLLYIAVPGVQWILWWDDFAVQQDDNPWLWKIFIVQMDISRSIVILLSFTVFFRSHAAENLHLCI